ncbi:hypothetical protein C0J52_13728 [Blattella germanica]|nr:hypothetical protein C0J52_13728 [Blattella germanica]
MNGGVLGGYCEVCNTCNQMKPLLTISPTQTVCDKHWSFSILAPLSARQRSNRNSTSAKL